MYGFSFQDFKIPTPLEPTGEEMVVSELKYKSTHFEYEISKDTLRSRQQCISRDVGITQVFFFHCRKLWNHRDSSLSFTCSLVRICTNIICCTPWRLYATYDLCFLTLYVCVTLCLCVCRVLFGYEGATSQRSTQVYHAMYHVYHG